MELAYFSGYSRLKQRGSGGAGVVLRFERVRAPQGRRFQPLKAGEITPQFLDRMIRALKRWKYDIVSMDEVCRRAVTLPAKKRFVALTFDGGYKDVINSAYPVLSKHGVPFAVYLPTAFPDWARRSLVAGARRHDRARAAHQPRDRPQGAAFCGPQHVGQVRDLPVSRDLDAHAAAARSVIRINDLCKRYSVDLAALSRSVRWTGTIWRRLAADPNVTIGSATVNYPVLSTCGTRRAARDAMGRAVAEAAFTARVRHFAYPFGDRDAFAAARGDGAGDGLASAATALPGVVEPKAYTNLHALPRVAWDGRQRSLRMMRVILSGDVSRRSRRSGPAG
jgi:peptidoglycan/xylan/chitin deacetylase (PgdA/CDA1 family)